MSAEIELRSKLGTIVPESLSHVVKNKHLGDISLATPQQLKRLTGKKPKVPYINDKILHWTLLNLRLNEDATDNIFLFGRREFKYIWWRTSLVTKIAMPLIFTKSGSGYEVVGEPCLEPDLPALCAALNQWGVGQSLGVPEFYFS